MFKKLTALIAVSAFVAAPSVAFAQDDQIMTLAEALAGASTDGWTIVDPQAEGAVPYQFGDNPTTPAELAVPYGDVQQATAGLFFFGDGVIVDCTDPAQICSAGFVAPSQDSIYMGFSMTMAGDIPIDGGDGNIINYSFPWIVDGQEPFVELDAFPGDTWQDMSQVVVAESRSPFTLTHQMWDPAAGFPAQPTLTFGLVNGDQIWVFVPVEQDPFGLREAIIAAAINEVLTGEAYDGSVSLPQALADAIATTRWGAAVHIHKGDFGQTNPSTITALPQTPRPPGSGYSPPTTLTLLGIGDPVAIPPATLAPSPAPEAPTDDVPVEETPSTPSADETPAINDEPADSGSDMFILALVLGGLVVLALLLLWFWRKANGRAGDDKPSSDPVVPFEVPDSIKPPPTQTKSSVRDDGTKVDWWGVPGHAEKVTYTYTDGTVRVESSSTISNDIVITRPDGTVERWHAQEVYDEDRLNRVVKSSYSRVDSDGNVLESTDWDGKSPYPP